MRKRNGPLFYTISGLVTLAIFFVATGFKSSQSIDPIAAGKQIYTKGTSPSGEKIFALMSGVKVPASVLPCVNCHGTDGVGRPEGGVTPSNLQWDILTKDNGGQFSDRRTHPPYTSKNIKRVITMGFDPAGNEILKAMPRYQLGQEDLSYLLAYLKVLGREKEKGIENGRIKTGFVLPAEGKYPAKRLALQKILEAYFSEINEKGGIYNRNIELQFFEPDFMNQSDSNIKDCFAIGNYWGMESEQRIIDWTSQEEMPVIGAVSNLPIDDGLENKYVFYLYPGLLKQVQALASFLSKQEGFANRNIAIIYEASKDIEELITPVKAIFESLGVQTVNKVLSTDPEKEIKRITQELKSEEVNTVFYLGTPGLENTFFKMAHNQAWYPEILCLGNHSDIRAANIPAPFDQRIFLAFPNWLDELSESSWTLYQSLKTKYKLSNDFQNAQLSTLGAAVIYIETIRNCGRKLTREKLIKELEKLYEYKTGLVPPVSYGLNNRIGSPKVYIASVNLKDSALKLETIIKK